MEDTVQGIVAAIGYDCAFDIFNLGNSSPVKLATLIEVIEAALGKKALLDRLPEQAGDVPITYADISKARALLGYNPGTPLGEGIARFVAWHKGRP